MAISVYDNTAGFVPVAGPTQFVTFKVGATAVKQGTAVKLSSGTVIPVLATGGGQIGVAACAGAVGDYIPVNVDPETLYEATTNDQAAAITDIGKYLVITAESSATNLSNQKVDMSAAATTITVDHVFQVVGLPGKVTNIAAASNLKVVVKMLSSALEPYVDATV